MKRRAHESNPNAKVILCHMSSVIRVERAEKFAEIQNSHLCAEACLNPRLFLSHSLYIVLKTGSSLWVSSYLSSKLKLIFNLTRKAEMRSVFLLDASKLRWSWSIVSDDGLKETLLKWKQLENLFQ